MVQTNQVLFTNAINVFSSSYEFPLPFRILEGAGVVTGVNNDFFQFSTTSSFDSNGNPIAKPGDIVRYASGSNYFETIVLATNNSGWIQVADIFPATVTYIVIYQRNENPGCAVFINGSLYGAGDITVELVNGTEIVFNVEITKNYILPVIAKRISNAVSQNGIYALY